VPLARSVFSRQRCMMYSRPASAMNCVSPRDRSMLDGEMLRFSDSMTTGNGPRRHMA